MTAPDFTTDTKNKYFANQNWESNFLSNKSSLYSWIRETRLWIVQNIEFRLPNESVSSLSSILLRSLDSMPWNPESWQFSLLSWIFREFGEFFMSSEPSVSSSEVFDSRKRKQNYISGMMLGIQYTYLTFNLRTYFWRTEFLQHFPVPTLILQIFYPKEKKYEIKVEKDIQMKNRGRLHFWL